MAHKFMEIKVTTKGAPKPDIWIRQVHAQFHPEMQARLVELGELTAQRMRDIIQDSIKRLGSSGRLENSIKSEILSSTAGVTIGIGRISELPIYWEVINDGGYVPPANRGFFASGLGTSGMGSPPMSGAGGEQWIHTGSRGDYLLNPKKPIDPVGYVNISGAELHMHIQREINNFMKKIGKTGASKSMFGATHVAAWGTRVTFKPYSKG